MENTSSMRSAPGNSGRSSPSVPFTAEKDLRSLAEIDTIAERLVKVSDSLFRIPGTQIRFGLDPIVGFLAPGVGDTASGLVSLYVVFVALRRRVPMPILVQMMLNLGLDALVGMVPFLGDAFDFVFRANDRNLVLLRRHADRAEPPGVMAYALVGALAVALLLLLLLPFMLLGLGIGALLG